MAMRRSSPMTSSTHPRTSRPMRAAGTVSGDGASSATAALETGSSEGAVGAVSFAIASGNPFSESTTLRYEVPRTDHVTIEVYDVRGAGVRVLVDEWQSAGRRTVTWDGTDAIGRRVPSGLYLSRLRVGADSRTIKLMKRP